MLTKLTVKNFKRFRKTEIELGNPVVFIGPNNSGKTTALQSLALWNTGLKRWNEKRAGKTAPEKRPGVTINRRDLIAVPVPDANLLWRDLHVRDVKKINGGQQTKNIRIEISVEGVSEGKQWVCGFEFDYANEESFYCRPLRASEDSSERMPVAPEAANVRVTFLPPMSGLSANETKLDPGAINVRLGEGRTAEVLRNLCYQVAEDPAMKGEWRSIKDRISSLFLVRLDDPEYIPERGEIRMSYRNPSGVRLDFSSSGRGLQQTLLLLSHMAVNPGSVLLLDEPDAHLEILRQRQVYELLTETARRHASQVIAASHSEVVLNEAADRDTVIAFVGRPHRIDDRGSQVLKSLKEIGYEQYYQAEQTGWVLYLEGSTDLAILRAFARTLGHPAAALLERLFVHYVQNQPPKAQDHFYGLREAKPDLCGLAVFDRLAQPLPRDPNLRQMMWRRREIENYLCGRDALLAWATHEGRQQGPLCAPDWPLTMEEAIAEVEQAMATLGKGSPWSADTKVTDDFLDPLFAAFFRKRGLPNLLRKTDYHVLAGFVSKEQIDPEVDQVLSAILETAQRAQPAVEEG